VCMPDQGRGISKIRGKRCPVPGRPMRICHGCDSRHTNPKVLLQAITHYNTTTVPTRMLLSDKRRGDKARLYHTVHGTALRLRPVQEPALLLEVYATNTYSNYSNYSTNTDSVSLRVHMPDQGRRSEARIHCAVPGCAMWLRPVQEPLVLLQEADGDCPAYPQNHQIGH